METRQELVFSINDIPNQLDLVELKLITQRKHLEIIKAEFKKLGEEIGKTEWEQQEDKKKHHRDGHDEEVKLELHNGHVDLHFSDHEHVKIVESKKGLEFKVHDADDDDDDHEEHGHRHRPRHHQQPHRHNREQMDELLVEVGEDRSRQTYIEEQRRRQEQCRAEIDNINTAIQNLINAQTFLQTLQDNPQGLCKTLVYFAEELITDYEHQHPINRAWGWGDRLFLAEYYEGIEKIKQMTLQVGEDEFQPGEVESKDERANVAARRASFLLFGCFCQMKRLDKNWHKSGSPINQFLNFSKDKYFFDEYESCKAYNELFDQRVDVIAIEKARLSAALKRFDEALSFYPIQETQEYVQFRQDLEQLKTLDTSCKKNFISLVLTTAAQCLEEPRNPVYQRRFNELSMRIQQEQPIPPAGLALSYAVIGIMFVVVAAAIAFNVMDILIPGSIAVFAFGNAALSWYQSNYRLNTKKMMNAETAITNSGARFFLPQASQPLSTGEDFQPEGFSPLSGTLPSSRRGFVQSS